MDGLSDRGEGSHSALERRGGEVGFVDTGHDCEAALSGCEFFFLFFRGGGGEIGWQGAVVNGESEAGLERSVEAGVEDSGVPNAVHCVGFG